MRLITRRAIYRAFPELDRFEDERCARFVRAAGRGFWKRARGVAVMVAAGMLIFAAVYAIEVGLTALLLRAGLDGWPGWMIVLVGVTPVVAGVFGGAWTRDLHLRRRIRRVLRMRGVCAGCRYSLVGLMVGEDGRVVCPECGVATEVDAALGELAVGEDGRARFKPGEDPLGLGPRYWTAARVRRVKRWAKWLGIGVPAAVLLLGLCYEVFLRWQASVARRERPGPAAIRAFMERGPAGVSAGGANGWDVLFGLLEERRAIDSSTDLPEDESGIGAREVPDFSSLEQEEPPDSVRDDPRGLARFERQRETARRLMAAYRQRGWFARLAELKTVETAAYWGPTGAAGAPVYFTLSMRELSDARELARLQRARMVEARRAADAADFAAALEETLTLAWMLQSRPVMLSRAVGNEVEGLAYEQVRAVVMARPEREWLMGIEDVLSRRRSSGAVDEAVRGEEMLALDAASWMFEDPGRVRLGRFSEEVKGMSGGDDYRTPLGTYAGNRDEIKAMFGRMRLLAGMAPSDRSTVEEIRPGYILTRSMGAWMDGLLRSEDLVKLEGAAARAMITLEWWRKDRGGYPESLEQLGPAIIMPIDPWTGKPVVYRRVDIAADAQRRGYLMYSVGADRVDDGGKAPPSGQRGMPFTSAMPGYDFILNDRGP